MSRIADEITRGAMQKSADRSNGLNRSVLRMSGFRAAQVTIGDIGRLPVQPDTNDQNRLTNSSGQQLFILGYSQLDGPHVLA